MSFFGSTAIVTGGASGIGLAISERLADDGAKVAIFDLDMEAAERAVKEITEEGETAIAYSVDVSDRAAVDAAVERVRSELGHVLVLVNAAGKDSFERFLDVTHRAVGTDHRDQPHRHLPRHAIGAARHDRGEVGAHRQHLVVECADRRGDDGALLGVEGRA